MQTDDLEKWVVAQGWDASLFRPYYADLGLSGTLRPDQRPDMLRLFDDIDAGLFDEGTILGFQENRFFRDETQIYYNQFIQKCKEHDILVVTVSPYVMLYDFTDEFLTEMFRWKCKEAADFIKRHVKGWMHPAREKAAKQGRFAGLGDIAMGYIVDYDEKSPTFHRFIPYPPHAAVIRWLFNRFMELCGDEGKLYRELSLNPVYFPAFMPDIDKRNVSRRKLLLESGGYRIRTRTLVHSILTNPVYIGYWSVKGVVVKKDNHEPLIDEETFLFAFNRLSPYTLDGEEQETPSKAKRYYQQETEEYLAFTKAHPALLKERITSHEGTVTVNIDRRSEKKGMKYVFTASKRDTWFYNRGVVELGAAEMLDGLVVERLFEHVKQLGDLEPYNLQLKKKQAEKQAHLAQIEGSIKAIDIEQVTITHRIRKTKNTRLIELYEQEIITLENERKELVAAHKTLSADTSVTLRSLDIELQDLESQWVKYPTDRKIALINFLVKEVVADVLSPHWSRLQVLWLHSEWGREELYYCGRRRGVVAWTQEENEVMKEHYPKTKKRELLSLLPSRNWHSILLQAQRLGLKRPVGNEGVRLSEGDTDLMQSALDRQFMAEKNIPFTCSRTNWTPVYRPASQACPC